MTRICSALRFGPIDLEQVVAVGPPRFCHHVAADEDLVRVVRTKGHAGFVNGTLIEAPAGDWIRAVNDNCLEIVGGDGYAGIGSDGFSIGSSADFASRSRGSGRGTVLNRLIWPIDRAWVGIIAVRSDKPKTAGN